MANKIINMTAAAEPDGPKHYMTPLEYDEYS